MDLHDDLDHIRTQTSRILRSLPVAKNVKKVNLVVEERGLDSENNPLLSFIYNSKKYVAVCMEGKNEKRK